MVIGLIAQLQYDFIAIKQDRLVDIVLIKPSSKTSVLHQSIGDKVGNSFDLD